MAGSMATLVAFLLAEVRWDYVSSLRVGTKPEDIQARHTVTLLIATVTVCVDLTVRQSIVNRRHSTALHVVWKLDRRSRAWATAARAARDHHCCRALAAHFSTCCG